MGYRLPALVAGAFSRFVPPESGPILDAGCGGGIQAEALALLGYGPLIGLDLSTGMLSIARAKGIYTELHQGALGAQLDLLSDVSANLYLGICVIRRELVISSA
ncbi:MAG: methyltransferase domain-containing protein [Pseudomonadota bacterium]